MRNANFGTPDMPVHEISKDVRDILAEMSNQHLNAVPLQRIEITPEPAEEGKHQAQPFVRVDW